MHASGRAIQQKTRDFSLARDLLMSRIESENGTMQLTHNRGNKSVALWAFAAAMFAVGLSLSSVACRDAEVAAASKATEGTKGKTTSTSEVVLTSTQTPAATLPKTPEAPVVATATKTKAPLTTISNAKSSELKVKRFVVAERIEKREPVAATEFTLSNAPIYAFAELENTGGAEHKVHITFEKGSDTTVGFVDLEVPASQPRWRTWGHTRFIREAGHWTAVLRTDSGEELARSEFDVKN
jgi:hypothetical protein